MGLAVVGPIAERALLAGNLTRSQAQDIRDENGDIVPFMDKDGDGWAQGITWRARYSGIHTYPGVDSAALPLDAESLDDKTYDIATDVYASLPFIFYASAGESAMNRHVNEDKLARQAADEIEAHTSAALARHLWTGEAGTINGGVPYFVGNASFATQGTDITPVAGTPANPVAAVATLLGQFTDDGWVSDIVFHCERKLLPALFHTFAVTREGGVLRLDGQSVLIADPGYPGTAPTGAADDAAGTWLFATGPVEYDWAELEGSPYKPNLSRINSLAVVDERAGITRFHGSKPHANGKGPIAYAVLTAWGA